MVAWRPEPAREEFAVAPRRNEPERRNPPSSLAPSTLAHSATPHQRPAQATPSGRAVPTRRMRSWPGGLQLQDQHPSRARERWGSTQTRTSQQQLPQPETIAPNPWEFLPRQVAQGAPTFGRRPPNSAQGRHHQDKCRHPSRTPRSWGQGPIRRAPKASGAGSRCFRKINRGRARPGRAERLPERQIHRRQELLVAVGLRDCRSATQTRLQPPPDFDRRNNREPLASWVAVATPDRRRRRDRSAHFGRSAQRFALALPSAQGHPPIPKSVGGPKAIGEASSRRLIHASALATTTTPHRWRVLAPASMCMQWGTEEKGHGLGPRECPDISTAGTIPEIFCDPLR